MCVLLKFVCVPLRLLRQIAVSWIAMDTRCSLICDDILKANLPQTLTTTTTVNINDIQDVDLLSAHEESQRSGSLIPLLKQELKYKIQTRRLTEGKDELFVTENVSSFDSLKLSSEELEKKSRRRQQNRCAARKFRQKEKERIGDMQQEIQVLEVKNGVLRQILSDLNDERNNLCNSLENHMLCCHVNQVYSNIPVP